MQTELHPCNTYIYVKGAAEPNADLDRANHCSSPCMHGRYCFTLPPSRAQKLIRQWKTFPSTSLTALHSTKCFYPYSLQRPMGLHPALYSRSSSRALPGAEHTPAQTGRAGARPCPPHRCRRHRGWQHEPHSVHTCARLQQRQKRRLGRMTTVGDLQVALVSGTERMPFAWARHILVLGQLKACSLERTENSTGGVHHSSHIPRPASHCCVVG